MEIQKITPPLNSFKNTFCVFHEVDFAPFKTELPSFRSDSGSLYFYTDKGMYRYSNHWGRLANCKWRLLESNISSSKMKCGFAPWENFYEDNDIEPLYYLEFDDINETIQYQHKCCKKYDGKAIIRTSKATQKRLKTARNILTLSNWAKYFENQEIDILRREIIKELIYTNKSIEQIKRERL